MADLGAAMEAGDYAGAYAAFIQQPDAGTQAGLANAALLLAMCERYDEAEQLLARTKAPAVEWIVRGDRARLARFRDPQAAGGLSVAGPSRYTPYYAAMGYALVAHDAALVAKTQAEIQLPPIAGTLYMHDNPAPRAFRDLRDCDDAIGRMFEIFIDGTVVYFPYENVKLVEISKPGSFIELYTPRVMLTERTGNVAHGFLPTLYAGSTTSPEPTIRTGRETRFSYVGRGRRGMGQRDMEIDGGTMMGIERIARIEFS